MNIAARMDFTGLTSGLSARAGRSGEKAEGKDRVVMKLEPCRAASLHARAPVEVACLSGQLWITLPGQLEDIVLQAGQCRVLNAPVQDVVLSTAGTRCPATFGLRSILQTGKRRIFERMQTSPFRVEFD